MLSSGDMIPADGFLLSGELYVSEAMLSGEEKDARKSISDNKVLAVGDGNSLFRSCTVLSGSGVMRVSAIGEGTLIGRIASSLSEDTRESPLRIRLSRLARLISRVGYVMAALAAAVYLYNLFVIESGFVWQVTLSKLCDAKTVFSAVVSALSLAITVIVVAVPEGLPMMICVVLSANMKRMLRDKILIKKPVGIETAGSMNILFCDKTGTLTSGKQSVEGIYIENGREISVSELKKYPMLDGIITRCAEYNCECSLKGGKAVGSNATDRAIAEKFSKRHADRTVQKRLSFDSKYKYSAVMLDNKEVIVKGAPEILLARSEGVISCDGRTLPINKSRIYARLRSLAEKSIRVIAIAKATEMPSEEYLPPLTIVALVGIRDKIRVSAEGSVKALKGAGVKVVMITGDNKDTAEAVAKECGILSDGDFCITGKEMAQMSSEELEKVLPRLSVVARSLPSDKKRLVEIAQKSGLVVGMTGDGVNDAPALKAADVGFSMGSGTDVAKEAGDIVILNNDISSIVKAVLHGRNIFKSIRKFIMFQLIMNICAVSVTLIGPFLGVESPISVVQMLWINMIMDTLGGIAFAGEAASADILKEKPKKREEPILNSYMIGEIVFMGGVTLLVCALFMHSERIREIFMFYTKPNYYHAALFSLFVFLGIVNSFAARTPRLNMAANIKKNKAFISIMSAVAFIQLLMVYFGGDAFRGAPISAKHLFLIFTVSLSVIPVYLIKRIFFSRILLKRPEI